MPKQKPNKGVLKRVRITKSGKIKYHRAGGRHLRSGKSGSLKRDYRKPIYAPAAEVGRFRAMLHLPVPKASDGSGETGD